MGIPSQMFTGGRQVFRPIKRFLVRGRCAPPRIRQSPLSLHGTNRWEIIPASLVSVMHLLSIQRNSLWEQTPNGLLTHALMLKSPAFRYEDFLNTSLTFIGRICRQIRLMRHFFVFVFAESTFQKVLPSDSPLH